MKSSTSASVGTTRTRSLVGRPHAANASYASDCRTGAKPLTAPMPCTTMRNGRLAVTRGSFCRNEPAAVLRGFANGALPASTKRH